MEKRTSRKTGHGKPNGIVKIARSDFKAGAAKVESAFKEGSAKVESAVKEGSETVGSLLKPGSPERVAAGVAAAAGGALLAAATLGVGQTALAGAAGYAAYRGMKKGQKEPRAATAPRKR